MNAEQIKNILFLNFKGLIKLSATIATAEQDYYSICWMNNVELLGYIHHWTLN